MTSRDVDTTILVRDMNAKELAKTMRVVRLLRMGKVRRHGRKGHRTYTVYPRNPSEMPLRTRNLMTGAEKIYQDC